MARAPKRSTRWQESELRSLFLCKKGSTKEKRAQTAQMDDLLRAVQSVLLSVEGSSAEDAQAAAAEIECIVQLQDDVDAAECRGCALQCKKSVLLAALHWMREAKNYFAHDPYMRRLGLALSLLTPRYLKTNCQAVAQYVSATVVLAELWGGEASLLRRCEDVEQI